MRLTEASVIIRPRRPWEALDLGVLIARRHAALLMGSWALVSLPVLGLLSLLLWQHPGWAIFLFWWLKPAFERLPLYILSRALFGHTPTLRSSLSALPGLLKPQLLASLTWRRLSPTRSFALPVLLLEGLAGQARRERLAVLERTESNAAGWLTLVGMGIEAAFYLGLASLLYLMLPQPWLENLDWQELIGQAEESSLWLEHLSNLFYALVLVFWEPIYVACGFTLYLNRRTTLEAWDVELAFRSLRRRLAGTAQALLLLGIGLFATLPASPLWAAPVAQTTVTAVDPQSPDAARLLHQPLTSAESQASINEVLQAAPFVNQQTVTRWRLGPEQEDKAAEDGDYQALLDLLEGVMKLARIGESLDAVAVLLKVLLWALLISLVVLLAWRYREWLQAFGGRLRLPQRQQRRPPRQLFGLEVAPESLPADVAGEAERLWNDDPRAALGLLYRALLSRLLHDFRVPIKAAHTEGEVLQLTQRLQLDALSQLAGMLTAHWQNLAYGRVLPDPALKLELCESWRRQFGQEQRT